MTAADVAVVIPTWNAGSAFRGTLDAVRRQRDCGRVDLLVIDSESTDATVRLAEEFGARTRRILRYTFNHGVTRNLGAALTDAPFIAFLTQDAEPANEHWLRQLLSAFEDDNVAGAYSRVLPRPHCSPLVERSVRADLVYSETREHKRGDPARIAAMSAFERRVFFHFNNVSSMVRRELFARMPFPEIPFGEDLAWGGRVLQEGYDLVFEAESMVFHSHESRLLGDFLRHREDARLMRTLFGFRNRDGVHDSLPAWWQEWRRDREYLRQRPLPWWDRLRWSSYGALLRAFQIAGQWSGSYQPVVRPPMFAGSLPATESRQRIPDPGEAESKSAHKSQTNAARK